MPKSKRDKKSKSNRVKFKIFIQNFCNFSFVDQNQQEGISEQTEGYRGYSSMCRAVPECLSFFH